MFQDPVPVTIGVVVGPLKGIPAQVEDLRQTQGDKGFGPKLHGLGPLLGEDGFPISISNSHNLAVIIGIEEPVPRALLGLAGEVGQDIVAVDLDLEIFIAGLVPFLQLLDDIGITGRGQQWWATIPGG